MKTRGILSIVIFSLIMVSLFQFSGCSASKTKQPTDSKMLDDLMTEKNIHIESDRAFPQMTNSLVSISNSGLLPPGDRAGTINLIGNSNFLIIKGDSISGDLPYFGERQMGAYPGNTNIGIEFDGIPKKYSEKRGKKNSYIIQFSISDKENTIETYNITLQLYPNMRSNIRVNSTHRFPIEYRGNISKK